MQWAQPGQDRDQLVLLRRSTGENLPVAELAKSFGPVAGSPKAFAASVTTSKDSSTVCPTTTLDDILEPDHAGRMIVLSSQRVDWGPLKATYYGHLGRSPIHLLNLCGDVVNGLICRVRTSRKLEEALDADRLRQIEQARPRVDTALKQLEQIEENGKSPPPNKNRKE